MNLICPQCNQPIDENDYNISTDIAYCRGCDATHSLATLFSLEAVDEQTFADFERSCCQELGRETTALVPFNKGCRVIGVVSLLGIFAMLCVVGFLLQTRPWEAVLPVSLIIGAVIVLDLFLSLFFLAGKYVVSLEYGQLRVCTGVFPILVRKQASVDQTTSVRLEKNQSVRVNHQPVEQIVVETDGKKTGFGILLSDKNKKCLMKWLVKHIK